MIDRSGREALGLRTMSALLGQPAHEPSTTGRTLEKRRSLIAGIVVPLKRETADPQNGLTITRITIPTISTAGTSLRMR